MVDENPEMPELDEEPEADLPDNDVPLERSDEGDDGADELGSAFDK